MNIRIVERADHPKEEIVIYCQQADERIAAIEQSVREILRMSSRLTLYRAGAEYHLSPQDILFFETDGNEVYAHTAGESYATKKRLYELEKLLPLDFLRVSKSTILNTGNIYSLARSFGSSTRVSFAGTHKHVYISRRYYPGVKQHLHERKKQ